MNTASPVIPHAPRTRAEISSAAANVPGTSRPSTPCAARAGSPRRRPRRRRRLRRRARPCAAMSSSVAGSLAGAALAHHVGAHRAVRHLGGDVDARGMRSSASRYSGKVSQSHRIASRSDAPGMSSTPSISPMSQSWRSGAAGAKPDAAVAHDHGGDAVPDRRREQRVPGDLAVVVGVHVDEAGRDRRPVASSSSRPGSSTVPTAVMRPSSTATSAEHRASPAAVDHRSVADHEIVHAPSP